MVKNHLKARKQSKDPIQEDLRKEKDNLNEKVSDFINNLIHYKKLINGYPNKFYMEKSKIYSPIPGNPSDILSNLVSQYSDIVDKTNSIINKQNNYSQIHQKKQEQKKSKASDLKSFASNPLSRFLSRITNISLTDTEESRKKKYRISMLNVVESIYKKLNDFEYLILKSDNESIFEAEKIFQKIKKDWMLFNNGISVYQNMLDKKDKKTKSSNQPNKNILDAKKIIEDIKNLINKYQEEEHKDIIAKITELKTSFNTNLNNEEERLAEEDAKKIIELYKKLTSENLESVANNYLSKMFMKAKHNLLNNFNKLSAFRLDCYKKSESVKDKIDLIMDSLESDMNIEYLSEQSKLINKDFEEITSIINILSETIKGIDKGKSFMDLIKNKKITDIDISLTEEENKKLQELERRKRIRELLTLNE